jgi:hypothetical protein
VNNGLLIWVKQRKKGVEMKDFTMVIPSYWGQCEGEMEGSEEIVFDHPTALDSTGTLGRLLDSLDIFDRIPGRIVIIAVPNMRKIAAEVEDKINQIITPYRKRYDICTLGQSSLNKIKQQLVFKGVSEKALAMINLDNYAAVRNVCSLAGVLDCSRYTIFIDDDEVFNDRYFLEKIDENMQRQYKHDTIEALTGYCIQHDTYRLDVSKVPQWRRPYWNNAAAMNETFDLLIGQGERIKPSPFALGGIMTLALDVLKKVPFDPQITRGEDMDFLLNLRIHGKKFYLDRELAVEHLQPASTQKDWIKMREDAVRFLYGRKKVTDHDQLSLSELQPYPGMFLGDDLDERIIKSCELLKGVYESRKDEEGVIQCQNIIAIANENPFNEFDTRSWLIEITADWQEITASASGLGIPE